MIGSNIKKLRLQHGMTQKNLADKLFVSAQAVSRWENNEAEPSISTILELAKIFGVTADEILNPEDQTPQQSEKASQSETSQKEEIKEEKAQDKHKQMLALCENCNSPIYDSGDIVRENDKLICSKCHQEKAQEEQIKKNRENDKMLRNAKRRRILSFIFGALAAIVSLSFSIAYWNHPLFNRLGGAAMPVAMFTFVSCCILNNNFVGYLFLRIATWSIKAPFLIFTFDIDGCLWFIAIKILLAILGFILGVLMFILGIAVGAIVSVFVYPYAIVTNIRHPEKRFFEF